MAWKNLKQRSLAESMLIEHDALKELDDVHKLITWSRIEALLSGIHMKTKGEKAWPPLIMFKALLLQSWYGLSDPALEKQLARDLLFRRFVGLDISESVPDHSTFWRFRQKLEKGSLMETLLSEVNQQLSEQGLYIKSGEVSIVDASVIEANQCRPNKRKDGSSTQDPDAAWNVKAGSDGKRKSTYGYKAHINVDEDGFIKRTDYSKGSLHDSNCFTSLLSGKESAVYADSAYLSGAHEDWLSSRNIKSGVIKRAYRGRPLTAEDKRFNRLQAGVRCTVERVFGVLKLHYGMAKARYLGLSRNRTRFELMCVAHNIKRGVSIRQASYA
ncbi:MAG: IS5 family transposase [Gammaproteobacteria bacterium]|nr:IS5 family transposase [Gammaproteobacteria bacterium]